MIPQRTTCGLSRFRCPARYRYRRIGLTEAEQWIDHLGSCSPCYVEYNGLRRKITKMQRIRAVGIVASIALFMGLGSPARREHWGQCERRERISPGVRLFSLNVIKHFSQNYAVVSPNKRSPFEQESADLLVDLWLVLG
jgi:hypothetical protein